MAPGLKIHVTLELASDIPKCLIDPTQFNVAILNLVFNARDAMPNGEEVQISTARRAMKTNASDAPGTYVQVRVKDNGQGMSADIT